MHNHERTGGASRCGAGVTSGKRRELQDERVRTRKDRSWKNRKSLPNHREGVYRAGPVWGTYPESGVKDPVGIVKPVTQCLPGSRPYRGRTGTHGPTHPVYNGPSLPGRGSSTTPVSYQGWMRGTGAPRSRVLPTARRVPGYRVALAHTWDGSEPRVPHYEVKVSPGVRPPTRLGRDGRKDETVVF